jgi:hypothetical protein
MLKTSKKDASIPQSININQNEEIFENSNGTVGIDLTQRSNLDILAEQIIKENLKRSSSMNPG